MDSRILEREWGISKSRVTDTSIHILLNSNSVSSTTSLMTTIIEPDGKRKKNSV